MRRQGTSVACAVACIAFLLACDSTTSTTIAPSSTQNSNDASATCPSGETSCASSTYAASCVNTAIDDHNCGACANVCGAGSTCTASKCVCTSATESLCDNACIDTSSDPKNCGACGFACPNSTCTSGECEKIVFATHQLYPTNLDGKTDPLTAADNLCQAEAVTAGYSGKFKAWLADQSDSPSTRFTQSALAYVLPDGTTRVAADWTALTSGTLDHAIDQDSAKNTLAANDDTRRVMTNVAFDGTSGKPPLDCNEWTQTSGSVQTGDPTITSSNWTDLTTAPSTWDCTNTYRLYCFAQ